DAQYATVLQAASASYRLGAGSLLQLEDVRRTTLSASQSLAAVRLERAQKFFPPGRGSRCTEKKKAVGGGWSEDAAPADAASSVPAPAAERRAPIGNAS
ncbi:RND transporter, partial [Ralstonia solanacearum]